MTRMMNDENIYKVDEIDYRFLLDLELQKKPKGSRKHPYYNMVSAFDIETTNIDKYQQAIMYIWQFQLGSEYTIIGRTWDEFKLLLHNITQHLEKDAYFVILVHNLSFEWQFLKSIIPIDEVFAMDDRKVLYFRSGRFEFRCTYLHSNMTLDEYVSRMGATYRKVKGFDYTVKRYPWTELTDQELLYCINDVRSLQEAYCLEMDRDGDNLYTIPYTSTGYPRRIFKKILTRDRKLRYKIKKMLPNFEVFTGLRKAFRGGNTHANRYNVGRIIYDADGMDISSSYIAQLLNCEYPMGEFIKVNPNRFEIALRFNRACLMRMYIEDVKLKNELFGCPYLAKGKVEWVKDAKDDNGRILSCSSAELWLTEIDFAILCKEYDFNYEVRELWITHKDKLPIEFREALFEMYETKTKLKGTGDDYSYNKFKSQLNSVYGMMVQNPCKVNYILNAENDLVVNEEETLEELIEAYLKNGWVPYQWGVWCTAYARLELEEALHSIPYTAFIYADTDSVKFEGDYRKNIEALNEQYKDENLSAIDSKGHKHYLGIFEYEEHYEEFSTLGAKKYVYTTKDKAGKKQLHCTISGVQKELGAKELKSINNFKEGFTFKEAGGNMAIYNDHPEITHTKINGHDIEITSNLAIYPSTYTLGITAEYERLIRMLNNTDISYALHYER